MVRGSFISISFRKCCCSWSLRPPVANFHVGKSSTLRRKFKKCCGLSFCPQREVDQQLGRVDDGPSEQVYFNRSSDGVACKERQWFFLMHITVLDNQTPVHRLTGYAPVFIIGMFASYRARHPCDSESTASPHRTSEDRPCTFPAISAIASTSRRLEPGCALR